MRERLQLPTPLWTLHYNLLGGHRRTLQFCTIYIMTAVAIWSLFRHSLRDIPPAEFADGALRFLAAVQLALLILGGCGALHRAMLRDYESKMIESHRLTPLSNVTVILGYLFGPTIQMLSFFTINVFVGLALCAIAGAAPDLWILGNVLALLCAVMVWTLAVFFGIRLAKPTNPIAIVAIGSSLAAPMWGVPGLGLFSGVYVGFTAYSAMTGSLTFTPAAVSGIIFATLVLTVFWLLAGAARYRRPDLPALAGVRGLTLLSLWLVFAFGGQAALMAQQASRIPALRTPEEIVLPWIALLIASILLALPAVSGSVACAFHRVRGTPLRDWSDRMPDFLITSIALLFIAAAAIALSGAIWNVGLSDDPTVLYRASWLKRWIPTFPTHSEERRIAAQWMGVAYTVLTIAIMLFTLRSCLRLTNAIMQRPWIACLAFPLLLWVAIPATDFFLGMARYPKNDPFQPELRTWLFGASPFGTIVGIWQGIPIAFEPGLLVQLALLLLIASFAARFWRLRTLRLSTTR